jgi:hypothetical protein
MVHIQGRDLFTIPTPVSIAEYLHCRLIHDAMDGPLTDYESAGSEKEEDSENEEGLGNRGGCSSEAPPISSIMASSRKKRKKNRLAVQRQRKKQRVGEGEREGKGLKEVCKKRRREGANNAIQLPYILFKEASLSATGWIGKQVGRLPLECPTLYKLVNEDGLAHFPWDGWYVALAGWV